MKFALSRCGADAPRSRRSDCTCQPLQAAAPWSRRIGLGRYNWSMEDLVNPTSDLQESVPKRNRGRFQPGDTRINREGRPPRAWNRARRADRLMWLSLDALDLIHRITHERGPWIVNLPDDTAIVACHWNAAEEVVMLVLHSSTFPQIARGALIPEFAPQYHGLRWKRR
jgi:hypothetical protein